jgi:hypothetical protein
MTTMIEAVIYDKPAIMRLVTPFSDVYMIIGEEAISIVAKFAPVGAGANSS